ARHRPRAHRPLHRWCRIGARRRGHDPRAGRQAGRAAVRRAQAGELGPQQAGRRILTRRLTLGGMIRTPPQDHSGYAGRVPQIGGCGFLSDCGTAAVVAPDGGLEWLCLPRMDSPSVFGSMRARDAGVFRISPAGVRVPSARRYIPGTLVLETSWWIPGGWLVVTDALLMGPWHHDDERSKTHRRAPTDYDAGHVLLRRIRCVNGQVQVRMDCSPVFDYGRAPAEWAFDGPGYREAVASAPGSDVRLRLTTDMNVGFEGPQCTARTLLRKGESRFVALSWSEHAPPRTIEEA